MSLYLIALVILGIWYGLSVRKLDVLLALIIILAVNAYHPF